jgi:hypothetical protein
MGAPSSFDPAAYTEPKSPGEAAAAAAEPPANPPLRIDDVILLLQEARAAKGNLVVSVDAFHDGENAHSIDPVVGHYYEVDDNRVAQKLVLCHQEHLEFAAEQRELDDEEIIPNTGGN